MTRTVVLGGKMLQYAFPNPKYVSIILHGIGQIGTDLTVIERITFVQNLKNGTLNPNSIILLPQLQPGNSGWFPNTLEPVFAYAQSLNLPIHFSGLSLGGMAVSANLVQYISRIKSAMTCPGLCDNANLSIRDAYKTIPSRHYYDPADGRISYGYGSIKTLVDTLQAGGKTDISLIELPGFGHDVWDAAYMGVVDSTGKVVYSSYFDWVESINTLIPIVEDDIISSCLYGSSVIHTTKSGKKITVNPISIK